MLRLRITPGAAIIFGTYVDAAYNVASANLSSPQTTELFAGARAATLWKHVVRADAQVAMYAALGAWINEMEHPGGWIWPVVGAGLAGVIMHCSYIVALRDGRQAAGQSGSRSRALW